MTAKQLPVLMESGVLKLPDGCEIVIGSETWAMWLLKGQSFRYEGKAGNVTVSPGKGGWYAYKRVKGKLYSAYVGRESLLNVSNLETIAANLIHKGEENKPVANLKQSEMDELKAQVSGLHNELEAMKEELKRLSAMLGKSSSLQQVA